MKTVFVTGAGVSASAGIPLYRDGDSAWADKEFEKISHSSKYGMYLDQLVPRWVEMKESFTSKDPTVFHQHLAEKGFNIITQNIDGMHQKAGSENVVEVHGNITEWRCMRCKKEFLGGPLTCPFCESVKIRPNIVLFGEKIMKMKVCEKLVRQADVVVFAGTSGNVYPVTSWASLAKRSVLIDPNPWGSFDTVFEMTTDEWVESGSPFD